MVIDKKDLETGKDLVKSLMDDLKENDHVPENKFLAYIVGSLDFQLSESQLTEYQYTVLMISVLGEDEARKRIKKLKKGKG